MSRAFTRVLVTSAISGFAVLPTLAYAADAGPGNQPQVPTAITVAAPKNAHANIEFSLSAKVDAAALTKPTDGPRPSTKGATGRESNTGDPTVKKGKGHGKTKGKGGAHHQKRHAAETGTVTFTVDGKTQPPVKVERGRAAEKIDLPPGSHTVTAVYSGDGNYRASKSAPVTFSVS
jgi:hypothetical protein